MKAYKVVKEFGEGARLCSAWVWSQSVGVSYEIGVRTKPKVRGSCLMAFDSLKNALTWKLGCVDSNLEIYECEIIKSKSKRWVFIYPGLSAFQSNFDAMMKGIIGCRETPPNGSIKCSSITLTKKIEDPISALQTNDNRNR